LARLQAQFFRQVSGLGGDDATPALDASAGIAPALGLRIYAHAYGARLREALHSDHAALAAYLGAAAWARASADYIAAQPSRQRSLRQFGDGLPAFLRAHRRYRERPELAELAAFERALLDSFDAADASPVGWQELLALPAAAWPSLAPRLHPALGRLSTTSNCVESWLALQGDGPRPALSVSARGEWAIWRDPDLVTRFRSLPPPEAMLLDHFRTGGDFASGCEHLTRLLPADEVPAQALQYLGQWSGDGWISRWSGEPAGA
jgi:hypothetical protein